jgi:uncharacterized protein (TIGR02246 family)
MTDDASLIRTTSRRWAEEIRMGYAHNPADIYPALLKAFNAGDVDATVACYEPQACFVLKSGHTARGVDELREMYRATFSYKPGLELDVRKIISAGDDLVLVVVEWKSKIISSSGEAKVWAGTATDIVRKQPDGTWKLALDNPYGVE